MANINFSFDANAMINGFELMDIKDNLPSIPALALHDVFKIYFITTRRIINYRDKQVKMEETNLIFKSPSDRSLLNYTSPEQSGYVCFFTTQFLKLNKFSKNFQLLILFNNKTSATFLLDHQQKKFIATLFDKMVIEQNKNYIFKEELLHNYINLIIHEALKIHFSHFFDCFHLTAN